MLDIVLRTRFVEATVVVVVALTACSVSDCNAQPGVDVKQMDNVRVTAKWSHPGRLVGTQIDGLYDSRLASESAQRVELAALIVFGLRAGELKTSNNDMKTSSAQAAATADPPDAANNGTGQPEAEKGFQWGGAVKQSMFFLGIMHGFRMAAEQESRAELRGPFFKDYIATTRRLRGWRDGDRFLVNYVAHPMQGAVSGFVQIQNDPKAPRQELRMNRAYWNSRLKAMGWAALFSTQFELGPISEASLGNVGLKRRDKAKNPMALVDLVVTPTVGIAWLVGEDVLDRHVVRRMESKVTNRFVRVLVRSFLNPSRSMSNVLRLKYPWHRDTRSL